MTGNAKATELTRRSFLKSTALAAGAMAAASTVGLSSVGIAEEAAEGAPQEQTFINTCRGTCSGPCVLEGKVRDGKLVSVMPMTFPSEYEGVKQGCVRCLGTPVRTYGTHRLLHPMKRVGERGAGQWEQITWDEAFQMIADKFQGAFDEYGPQSVAVWSGGGNSFSYLSASSFQIANWAPGMGSGVGISRFMQKTGVTGLSCDGDQAGMYMLFYMLSTPKPSVENLADAKTLILWGSNPAEASLSKNAWHWICKAREKGAKVIVIDPLYTPSAAHSDEWVPIRVGTDSALMCAMVNYIVANGLEDVDYLKRSSVAPLLVKGDGTYLRLSELGLAEAGSAEDVPAVWDEDAQTFVAHNAAANPALNGTYDANGVAVTTVYDLSLESIKDFTVEFAEKECGIPAAKIEELARLCCEGKPTFLSIDWGIEHTFNAFRIYYNAAFLASVIGGMDQPGAGYSAPNMSASSIFKTPPVLNTAGVVVPDAKPVKFITGDYLVDIMATGKWAGEDYPIRSVYIQAHSPLDNSCDPDRMIEAWEKIDFVVTAEQFMTTTANYSDLVLPVSVSWESQDFTGKFMLQKAIEAAGESKTDFDIWVGIANAMGYTDLYDKTAEEYLREYLDTPENLEAGLGYDAYYEQGAIVGEYQFASSTSFEYNPLGRTQFFLEHFIPRDEQGIVFPQEDKMPYYERSIESYVDNPDRAQYPLFGFFNHEVYHSQCNFAHNVWLDEFRTYESKPYCRLHTAAAQERGIVTGDKVRVFNSHGSVVLNAIVTEGIEPESVWLPHGFFWDEYEEGFAQSLTGYYPDPQTCNANFNDFICQVEKYEGGAE